MKNETSNVINLLWDAADMLGDVSYEQALEIYKAFAPRVDGDELVELMKALEENDAEFEFDLFEGAAACGYFLLEAMQGRGVDRFTFDARVGSPHLFSRLFLELSSIAAALPPRSARHLGSLFADFVGCWRHLDLEERAEMLERLQELEPLVRMYEEYIER